MNQTNDEKVHITFTKAADYRTTAATGVCGGTNPVGELVCSFYVEQKKLPTHLTLQVDPQTTQIKEAKPDVNENEFVRELQTSVVMRPDVAISVGKWLIKEAEKVLSAAQRSLQAMRSESDTPGDQ